MASRREENYTTATSIVQESHTAVSRLTFLLRQDAPDRRYDCHTNMFEPASSYWRRRSPVFRTFAVGTSSNARCHCFLSKNSSRCRYLACKTGFGMASLKQTPEIVGGLSEQWMPKSAIQVGCCCPDFNEIMDWVNWEVLQYQCCLHA
jgi:hypothetical protein